MTGDIYYFRTKLSWRPGSWLAACIRFFAQTKWNHVAVEVNNWDAPFLNEAIGSGVHASPLKDALKGKEYIIMRYKYTLNEKEFCVKANSALGTPYDYAGTFLHQLYYQITGNWKGHTEEFAKEKMYCYEYVAWCHNIPQWWKVDPLDMLNDPNFVLCG